MMTTGSDINVAAILATIVLADSDPDRLAASARLLEEAGYSVITASSAVQAESLTRLYRPDLLILDGEPSDDSCIDLTRQVKLNPQLAGVFVVQCTAERPRTRRSVGEESERPDGYLMRPCSGLDFLDRVQVFLRLRLAQESLRESEGRYRTLFVSTKNPFAVHEAICTEQGVPYDCLFLDVNAAFEKLAGRPAAQIAGKSVLEVFPVCDERWSTACRNVAHLGRTVEFEGYFGPDRRYYQVEVYAPQPGRVATMFTDVTGLCTAQEELAVSEERYRAMVETFDGSIYLCSPDYRITFMNEELIRRRGEALGEKCFKALHDLDEVCPWCVNERVFRGETVKWEVQSPKDGRWYYVIDTPIQKADGTVHKQAMIHDITHLKEAEAQLRLKSFTLENLAEEVIWPTSDCRVMDVNRVACEKLGYSREELLKLSAPDLDPNYPKDACNQHWAHLKQAGTLQFESVHRTKEGRIYPVEIVANYLNHDGLEYNCSIVRDITERKQLERALAEEEELFRTLCDSAPIGIFRCDADWNNLYCNPRWEEIVGLPTGEGLRCGWLSAIHPDDREALSKVRQQAAASGCGYTHEHRKVTPQGKVVWVRVLVNPIKGENGAILGHVGTVEDITEVRQARQEILKAQKLESIGVLAGGIAHDFNNILTAILGNISLASYQVNDPEKVAKRLKDAEGAASRARDLTQQLLTFARGGEPVKKVIEVAGLLREAVAFALHGSCVGCEFSLAEDLWQLEADEGQLVQVIHNLVLNAVQAMPQGGTITVAAANDGSWQHGEGFVEIAVTDYGIGMSEQHLERIFDPYFTTKQHGSGLGLASCYSIVKKHRGTIMVDSTLGEGSTFRVLLPAATQERVAEKYLDRAMSRGTSRILVMDDEEIVRNLAKAVLEQLGYRAECVENGSLAAEAYQKGREAGEPFAAVILDLTVPGGIGGREAIGMLRGIDPEVKAIVCSGYSTDPVMANFRHYGFNAVLSKPYRPHELSKVLQQLLAP